MVIQRFRSYSTHYVFKSTLCLPNIEPNATTYTTLESLNECLESNSSLFNTPKSTLRSNMLYIAVRRLI